MENTTLALALLIGRDALDRSLNDMSPYQNIEEVLEMFRECLPAAGTECATEAVLWAMRSAVQVANMPQQECERLLVFINDMAIEVDSLHLPEVTE